MGTLVLTYSNQGQWTEEEKLEVPVMKTSLRMLRWEKSIPIRWYLRSWRHPIIDRDLKSSSSPTKISVLDLALKLLNDSTALLSWAKLYDLQRPWENPDMTLMISDLAQPLYYATSTGVPEVVQCVLHQTIDIDAEVGRYSNALRVASRYGYAKIVRILLNAGANVNSNKLGNGSALPAAARHGHEEVVRILLDAGANVNANVDRYGNALEAAATRGSEDICKILLDAGANFDTRSSALHFADRHLGILKMLLEAGVDVEAKERYSSTPLQTAVLYGLDTTV